ncbi:DUF4215 domain-containing protein [Patescibacteria group bacterium]|nr:MAG: DUF4215 domain-containing protein [Patescibacteria group bacterium]
MVVGPNGSKPINLDRTATFYTDCWDSLAQKPAPNPKSVYVTVCGDGRTQLSEECDDGNNASGDGCSDVCKTESVACTPPGPTHGECKDAGGNIITCGSGVAQTTRYKCDGSGAVVVDSVANEPCNQGSCDDNKWQETGN